ncbi:MAG: beta-galactosidase GalA [Candidatus Acidiferrales bacterium]
MPPKNFTRRDVLKIAAMAPAAARAFASQSDDPLLSEAEALRQKPDSQPDTSTRERLLLDFNWRFHFGHADDPTQDFNFGKRSIFAKSGELFLPSRQNFDDSLWQAIDLPHDFAVALPFVDAPELISFGAKPLGREYPATSIGWYRRVFEIPSTDSDRRLSLEFDGVFRNCIVALNGHYLGRNLSGYAPFRYDITDFANYGGKNVLVVRVDATEHEGWFYEGAGIYRHVWLVKTNPLHVAHWGLYVTSEVHVAAAHVSAATEVVNESDTTKTCRVVSTIFDKAGKRVATARSAPLTVAPWTTHDFQQQLEVPHPALWSLEDPNMYRLLTIIEGGAGGGAGAENVSAVVDRYETPFGIRTFHFDPDKGLFLNGAHVEVKGTCNHQDHAGVGSALPDRIQYFRIERLKEMGANAYRTSHNPPTPALLDACDRLGMLVMDETRMMSSDKEGLSELERMMRRDRNHPSIFLWSLGNEEPEQGTPRGARIAATMKRLARHIDPTRPVTVAMNGHWGAGYSKVVDVQGFNYFHLGSVDKFHADFPAQPCIGSEEASTLSTRGIYENDAARGYVSAYDMNKPDWGSLAGDWWPYFIARPFIAGAFVWTGFDYRGEPTPYAWPCISSHFGIMDTCGFPKDNYFYYQAWWTSRPVLHVFPHWNWQGKEGQPISVWVHGNCEEVELFLNDQSLGKHPMPRNSHLEWKLNYAPGTLLARGFTAGKLIAESRQETTGAPTAIKLTPDRQAINADGEDVALITVAVLDEKGRVVPIADNEITFELAGPGKVIGVGNGDPSSHEPDKTSRRKAFNGLAQVIVQTQKQPGDIVLTAHSPGLQSATLNITANAASSRPSVF